MALPKEQEYQQWRPASRERGVQGSIQVDRCRLFVSRVGQGQRLPGYVTAKDLKDHFESVFGDEVLSAYIALDYKTDESKGFGFVMFASVDSAREAKSRLRGTLLLDEIPLYITFDKQQSLAVKITKHLECSSEHLLYLKRYFFVNPSEEAERIKQVLPAELTDKEESLSLYGSRVDVKWSEQILNEELLTTLGHTMTLLSYPPEFSSLVGEEFLTPVNFSQDTVTCILQQKPTDRKSGKLMMEIHLYSHDPRALQEATSKMKELQPCSKHYCLRPESLSVSGIKECIALSSKKHLTKAVKTGKLSVYIHGFRLKNIEDTWIEIKQTINNTIVTRNLPVSYYQLKYLQSKHIMCLKGAEAETEVDFPVLPCSTSSPNDRKTYEVKLKAKVCVIKRVEDKIKKESCRCIVDYCQVNCPKKNLHLWKKRWNRFVERQRRQNSVHIEYDCCTASLSAQGDDSSVSFVLYGDDKSALTQAKHAISNEENGKAFTEHEIKLLQKESDYIQRNVDSIQNDLEQSYQILCSQLQPCTESRGVLLRVPYTLPAEQLQKIEESIVSRIRDSVTKTFRFADSVAGHVFLSKRISAFKESHGTVRFSHEDAELLLKLEGLPVHLEEVVSLVKKELKELSLVSISNDQLSLGIAYLPLLSSSHFASFISSLQKQHGIDCTHPTIDMQETLLQLQTSTGHVVSIEVCSGDILHERTESILLPITETQGSEFAANKELVRVEELPRLIKPEDKTTASRYMNQIHLLINKDGVNTVPQALAAALETASSKQYGAISIPAVNRDIQKVLSPLVTEEVPESASELKQTQSLSGDQKFPNIISQHWTKQVLDSICNHAEVLPDTTLHTVRLVVPPQESTEVVASIFTSYSYSTTSCQKVVATTPVVAESSPSESCPPTSAQGSVGKWYWKDDNGVYTEYDQDANDKISSAWKSDNCGKCHVLINEQYYVIDFAKMKQFNVKYGTKRSVKHKISVDSLESTPSSVSPLLVTSDPDSSDQSEAAHWSYLDDTCRYSPYSAVSSKKLEDMYQSRIPPSTLKIGKWTYEFDFVGMKQINTVTSTERSIKRHASNLKPTDCTDLPVKSGVQILEKDQTVVINIRGPKEYLPVAKDQITTELKSLLVSKEIPLPSHLSITKEFHLKVDSICKKSKYLAYQIRETVPKEDSCSSSNVSRRVMYIEGEKDIVLNAQTELQTEVINYTSEAGSNIHYPDEWESQTQICEVFDVKKNSAEWGKLSTSFKRTMPESAKIKRIRRIQNKWLWEKYQQDMRRMRIKNNGMVNEKELFHGSRTTSADVILDSEEGFDMRFSSDGMWGNANYFAKDAKYSDTYAYSKEDGSNCKEMFVAKVLTGDSYESSPKSFRMPPLKSSALSDEVQLKQVRYDTVNGVTHGTRVYMTYSNEKAYPAYIIEYQCFVDWSTLFSSPSSGYTRTRGRSSHSTTTNVSPQATNVSPGATNASPGGGGAGGTSKPSTPEPTTNKPSCKLM